MSRRSKNRGNHGGTMGRIVSFFIYDGVCAAGLRSTDIYTNHDKAERQEYISRNDWYT